MFFRKMLLALFILAISSVPAASFTGGELYESASLYQFEREEPDLEPSYRSGMYMGYVKGVADIFGMQEKICTNYATISFGEIADEVATYILDNEWLKDLPPVIGVSKAFMELYPCDN